MLIAFIIFVIFFVLLLLVEQRKKNSRLKENVTKLDTKDLEDINDDEVIEKQEEEKKRIGGRLFGK